MRQKYLKALLIFHGVDFPRTHDVRLLMQLATARRDLDVEIDDVLVLNRYTVEARYPGDREPITGTDAEAAVAIAQQVRSACRAALPASVLGREQGK